MADNNGFCNLQEAMDKLWFHHNILFPKPIGIDTSLQSSSSKVSEDGKIRKKLKRLNIPINQPLYQLQLPTRVKDKGIDSAERRTGKMKKKHWNLPELENFKIEGIKDLGFVFSKEKLSPEMVRMLPGLRKLEETDENFEEREVKRTYLSERRMGKMRKKHWSLSELENFEIEGFKDLGFEFSKEKLSPEMVRVLPGLRRLEGEEENLEEREVRRPYLSEVWLTERSDSLLNLPSSHDSSDMKKHLRLWAHSVASSVHLES